MDQSNDAIQITDGQSKIMVRAGGLENTARHIEYCTVLVMPISLLVTMAVSLCLAVRQYFVPALDWVLQRGGGGEAGNRHHEDGGRPLRKRSPHCAIPEGKPQGFLQEFLTGGEIMGGALISPHSHIHKWQKSNGGGGKLSQYSTIYM